MDINYLALIGKIRFFFMRGLNIASLIHDKTPEKKEESTVMRLIRYVANNPISSFLNSRNFGYALNLASAATVFGVGALFGVTVSAYSMGLIPTGLILGSVCASIVMNGNELYKHKKMLKIHSVLTDMLNKVEVNQKQLSGLSSDQKKILNAVLDGGGIKSINQHNVPKDRKPLTAFGVATFRGVFSSSTLMAIAGSMVAMNPWAIGMNTAGWLSSMIGITDNEKRLYNMRMDFKDQADIAKQKLGCYTITSAASEYRRISAEAALLKAIKGGHNLDECRDIYTQVFEKTVPPIRRETPADAIKQVGRCSVDVLKTGFSSVKTAKLYEIPEKNKLPVVKNENQSSDVSKDIKKSKSYTDKVCYTEKYTEERRVKSDNIGQRI